MLSLLTKVKNNIINSDKIKDKQLATNTAKLLIKLIDFLENQSIISIPSREEIKVNEKHIAVSYKINGQAKNTRISRFILSAISLAQNEGKIGTTEPRETNLINEYITSELFKEQKQPISIVSGQEIIKIYSETDKLKSCSNYHPGLQLFAENPDKIQLLVVKNSADEPIARALIWNDDQGNKFIDRIYPNDYLGIEEIAKFARKNKYLLRDNHSVSGNPCKLNGRPVRANKKSFISSITLKLPETYYPYIDSYQYGKIFHKKKERLIQLYTYCSPEAEMSLIGARGKALNRKKCTTCGSLVQVREIIMSHCSECTEKNYIIQGRTFAKINRLLAEGQLIDISSHPRMNGRYILFPLVSEIALLKDAVAIEIVTENKTQKVLIPRTSKYFSENTEKLKAALNAIHENKILEVRLAK